MKTIRNSYFQISIIILISFLVDNLFIFNINNPPAWDQGFHLSNVFKMFNIIENNDGNIFNKIDQINYVTDSYRGPLTYFLSALFLKLFKNTYHFAYLSNQIFNIICIFSIFNLAKLFKRESVGIWASIIFTFSSLILKQRADYLIDLSLTSFCTLNLLFLTKWYLNKINTVKYSISSGITLGLIFLIKPTGIFFFLFPLIIILIKLIKKRNYSKSFFIKEISIFIFSFFIVIFPWFSKNWLTIITSTLNAWNWGIKYQGGLDANTLSGWFFYFSKLPEIFGKINSSIFFIIFFVEKLLKKIILTGLSKFNSINKWFFAYLLNGYLLVSFMSTKDIRFIMPIYPLICIYLAIFIDSKKYAFINNHQKKYILIISFCISIFLPKDGLILSNVNHQIYEWPHSQVINEIKKENSNLVSTLAILPDTREINTFNLEAEATRKGEYVAVRQIVSNEETYRDDLEYFDWFLVKTGNQGIMSSKSKNLLNEYLLNNNSFIIHKKWQLPDKSSLILLRRKSVNTIIMEKTCPKNPSKLSLNQINNGINISILRNGEFLKNNSLLIDINGKEFQKSTNISLANGFFHETFKEERCYKLSQDISINFDNDTPQDLFLEIRSLNNNGDIKNLNLENENLIFDKKLINNNQINMTNRITKVDLLGKYLRKGEFKNLFDLVGIINQSDPKQIYLKDAEKIFTQRYKDNKNLNDLYNILISKILQRKIHEAKDIINLILENEGDNGNAYLIKSIINIYLLDRNEARFSINQAKLNEKSEESNEILKITEVLIYLLEFKLKSAYNFLT